MTEDWEPVRIGYFFFFFFFYDSIHRAGNEVNSGLKIECACKYSAMRHSLTHAQRRRILLLRV